MVNLVIVSHSAQLGAGVGELARQMLTADSCKLAIAAGIDDPDNPIGTDPIKVMEAIESVAEGAQVLVMMDMGSALLSAETALELLDPEIASRVYLCAAPLVEGTLAATVSACSGAGIEKVMADAMHALEGKRVQLGLPPENTPPSPPAAVSAGHDAQSLSVTIRNPNGLHVRPAARLVAALAGFNAKLVLEKEGKCITPDSITQIALLQVRCHDKLRLLASGPDAEAALAAFKALAEESFGEQLDAPAPACGEPQQLARHITGTAIIYTRPPVPLRPHPPADSREEQRRLKQAIGHSLDDLNRLTRLAEQKYSGEIAAIFAGHHTLLDDPDLYDAACELIVEKQYDAPWAWYQVMSDLSQQYRQIEDEYLQARYIDIEDLLHRTLLHLQGTDESLPQGSGPTIIISDDIFPSTVLQLDTSLVKGICLTQGSALSHSALIAREAGIAFLCQQKEALHTLHSGEVLTLDRVAEHITHL